MREALERAMGREPDAETMQRLQAGGLAVLNEDTMSKAVHDVYCGIMATTLTRTRRIASRLAP